VTKTDQRFLKQPNNTCEGTVIKHVETGTMFSYLFPAKYHTRSCHRSLTRHFVGPTPAIFTIPMLLSLPINYPTDSYGATNQNAWQLRGSQSERAI